MNIKLLTEANGSDAKWFDVDGVTLGVTTEYSILDEDGCRLGEDWENQNWVLVRDLSTKASNIRAEESQAIEYAPADESLALLYAAYPDFSR